MNLDEQRIIFEEQMRRIQFISGIGSQIELAEFLGVPQASVASANRVGKIPSGWLLTLMRLKNVNPEWVLTGNGPCYSGSEDSLQASTAQSGDSGQQGDAEVLKRVSSKALVDELARRVSLAAHLLSSR